MQLENSMKKLGFLFLLLLSAAAGAAETKEEWQDTILSEQSIKNIQQANLKYKQCISDEMQKKDYANLDTRLATDKIIQQCEKTLASIREVLIAEKAPPSYADRYLKSARTKTARKVLEQMMFVAAAREAKK
jgi:hypothetical protein